MENAYTRQGRPASSYGDYGAQIGFCKSYVQFELAAYRGKS